MSALLRGCGGISWGSVHALDALAEASGAGASDRLISVCPSQNMDADGIVKKRTKPK